jgi:26S proteasome regulatory subunit (ATPase 3-interacting protein)
MEDEENEEEEEEEDDDEFGEESDFDDEPKKKKGGAKKAAPKKKEPAKRGKKAAEPAATPAAGKEKENEAAAPAATPAAKKTPAKKRASPAGSVAASPAAKKSKAEAAGKPGKDGKVKAVGDAEGHALIKDYMLKANRPYSHLQVFENLHKAVKKASVPKILEALEKEGVLKAFAFGKTVLYSANQANFPPLDQKELDAMDQQIENLTEELRALKETAGPIVAEVLRLESEPTNAALDGEIARLEAEMVAKRERLDKLASGVKLISEEEVQKTKTALRLAVKEWRTRRRACMDMVDAALGEESTQKPAQFMADHGIDTDEDAGVSIANAAKLVGT